MLQQAAQTLLADNIAATTISEYDGDGNLIAQTNPNGTSISSSYDSLGELTSQTWYAADGSVANSLHYSYDDDGNMLTAGNDAGAYTFAYNGDGEQTSVVTPSGVTLDYQYDDDGNVTQISDSLGDTVTSQYDADGNLTQRGYSGPNGQLLLTMSYDDNDNLIGVNRYADLAGTDSVGSSSYVYDAQGDVTSIVHEDGSGGTLASFSYAYDADDQLTQEVDNGTTTSYSYDAAGQLTSAGTSNYNYDTNGNPLNAGDTVGPDNELLTDGTWSYSYDADGNLTGKVGVAGGPDAGLTWTYSYDPGNEMTGATETNGSQTLVQDTFTYDVFGHLISMSISTNGDAAVATNFVYNGDELWAQLTGPSQSPTVYISGDQADQYFAQVDASNGVSWLLTDHLGSVRVVTNAAGQVTGTNDYDAYGNVISMDTPAQDATIGYAGSLYEITTGLNYEWHRWYNAQTGQWIEQDPLGLQAGPNPYEYVNDAPTNATDPTGMAAQPRSLTQDATIQRILGEEQQQRLATILQSLSPAEQQKVAQWWSKLSEEVRQKYAESFRRPLSSPGRSNRELAEGLKKLPESGQPDFTKVANLEAARRRQAEQAEFDALTRRPLTSQEEFAQKIMPSVNRATAARAADLRAASNYAIANRAWLESQDKRKVIGDFLGAASNMTLDLLPLLGEFKMGTEALAGIDVTGRKLTTGERALSGTTAALPLFGALVGRVSRLLRGTSKGGVIATELKESWALLKAAETPEALAKATARFEQAAAKATKELNVLNKTCFVAGTPLLTPDGAKRIEQFHPGDLVLSRSEYDADGPVEAKVVEEVFEWVGRILHLHVGGQVIRTTAEHPFWVHNQGWLPASRLRVGDLLVSHDGQVMPIEDLLDTEEYETVYNLRVADYHTYFVGCHEWGFSVWVHNQYSIAKVRNARELTIINSDGEIIPALLNRKEGVGFPNREALQAWAKENLGSTVVEPKGIIRVSRPVPPHTVPVGQIHHPLSNPILRELEQHPTLKGKFRRTDFTTQAWDEVTHSGYDKFHIDLDREVIDWIRNPANRNATPEEFVAWLRWRYSQPDVKAHFPNGF